jgi:hypothetical protein
MLALLFLLQDVITIPWDKVFTGGISFTVLVILLVVLLKLAPTWKEVKLKEIDSRDKASEASVAQSKALESVANVLYEVAVEQRRASDSVKVLQRVNSTKVDDLEVGVTEELELHDRRLAALEALRNVTNTTTAQSATAN